MVLTRRAHRARMLITLRLPNEVLTEIIRCAKKPDQATLCRVSRLFHGLVLPILNRAISLNLVDKEGCAYEPVLKQFLQSLIRNPERADAVRSLTFFRRWTYEVPVDHDLLFKSMNLMRNLESLSFNDLREQNTTTPRLACLTLPHLSRCCIMVTHTGVSAATDLARFLSQHPSIVRLFVWVLPLVGGTNSLDPGPTFLPNLRHYHGTRIFLDRLSTRSLQVARFPVEEARIESDVQAINALTNRNFPFVLSLEYYFGRSEHLIQTLLLALSAGFSHIRSLQLRAHDTNPLGITALQHVTTHLPHFNQIAYFSLTYSKRQPEYVVNAESDQAAFETWVATSSTLIGCCIGNVARKKLGEKWERLSVEDFDKQAGFSVFEPIWPDDD
ncbi:hypothetical protein FB45DRAFT_1013855 [Roridomyces roridus]|uniref:F-box domain-containing protein n=1 Tax=Roridomyces roridus TaxID=1738132 RepID=A0AAD7AXX5_9AGAR|nr:hypothetical protein FB45DRAFT_1013855 [Roridomyces roridus]